MIATTATDTPTEVIGTAAEEDGSRREFIVTQPPNAAPFAYVAPIEEQQPASSSTTAPVIMPVTAPNINPRPLPPRTFYPFVNQSSEVDPKDMNPLHYKNQIENTIYQSGDRLIDVQSIPLKDISSAVEPNLQPTITDYPSF